MCDGDGAVPSQSLWIQPEPASLPSPVSGWSFSARASHRGWWKRARRPRSCDHFPCLCSHAESCQTIPQYPTKREHKRKGSFIWRDRIRSQDTKWCLTRGYSALWFNASQLLTQPQVSTWALYTAYSHNILTCNYEPLGNIRHPFQMHSAQWFSWYTQDFLGISRI